MKTLVYLSFGGGTYTDEAFYAILSALHEIGPDLHEYRIVVHTDDAAAFAGLPMAIVYRGNWLNVFLARRLIRIDRIGLPNIVLGGEKPAFPELIQDDAEAAPLAARVGALLDDEAALASLRTACARVTSKLAGGPTSRAIAEEVLRLAKGAPAA